MLCTIVICWIFYEVFYSFTNIWSTRLDFLGSKKYKTKLLL